MLEKIPVISKLVHTELPPASAKEYSNVTQTEFLVINQSELERDKFGLITYCFILKAKQIIDETNI